MGSYVPIWFKLLIYRVLRRLLWKFALVGNQNECTNTTITSRNYLKNLHTTLKGTSQKIAPEHEQI
jgi:hypothetical protein